MPSHSDLPGEIKRKKFLQALRRLGFVIDEKGGDGSHCKITWPATQKALAIQSKLPKQVLRYVLKEIEQISGLTWDDIQRQL